MPEIKHNNMAIDMAENIIKQMKDDTKEWKKYVKFLEHIHYYRQRPTSLFLIICSIFSLNSLACNNSSNVKCIRYRQ